ncbi:hypothetical protein [Sulfuriroseicoccus oceanibius]|uniref:Uncharacterized protein n=1 Tax=Sulfuriroseicoccus oceanibius TaxID=2707525 RepID=A0A6B3LF35_9BACT|nr:hypothetical protein [Sulfuriroseicoccus oceanibius]QQL44923.1 hypothetical protein G3M56_013810 [Sulfuriroseicoccus oceanibius]
MKPKLKRALILSAIAVTLLTIAGATWFLSPALTKALNWPKARANWEAKGESFDPHDFQPAAVTDSSNAALHPWLTTQLQATEYPDLESEILRGIPEDLVDKIFAYPYHDRETLPRELAQRFLDATANAPSVALATEISSRPNWQRLDHNTPFHNDWAVNQVARDLKHLWYAHSACHLILDNPEEAWRDAARIRTVRDWTKNGIGLTPHLLNVTTHTSLSNVWRTGIELDAWTDNQLLEIARSDGWETSARDRTLQALRGEVASSVATFQSIADNAKTRRMRVFIAAQQHALAQIIMPPISRYEALPANTPLIVLGNDLETTSNEHSKDIRARLTETLASAGRYVLTTYVPAVCEEVTQSRLTRVAAALTLYHRQHGHYPKSIDALTPDILPAPATDPMTNGSLLYRIEDDGSATIWSVGIDQTDDQGKGDDVVLTLSALQK